MIFNSQSAITDLAREAAWGQWYFEHLRIMATVPGVFSAQRFLTTHAGHPRSLAIYGVANADVFKGQYYLSVRGMGEWLPLIDRQWYRRNLFDGLDFAPMVNDDEVLLVADRDTHDAALSMTWLSVAGIDRSTPYRGYKVINKHNILKLPCDVAVYEPASQRYVNVQEKQTL